ncbi:MAG: XdhC family protein, partial [Hyphomicrobiales bacterium]
MELLVWARIRESIEAAGRVALVTIVSTRGSAPREPGARMIVRPDGSFTGTIGGGKLEYQI